MTDALQLRDNARYELEQIKDLETGIDYLNKVKAIETWARAEKKDAELQNMIAEQKLRTQRILGNLIREGQKKNELAKEGSFNGNRFVGDTRPEPPKKLADLGITPKQSSVFQQIAKIPEKTFEEYIQEKKQAVNNAVAELTTTGAVRLARSLKQTTKFEDDGNDYQHEVSELIRRINELPLIYRLKVKQGIRRG